MQLSEIQEKFSQLGYKAELSNNDELTISGFQNGNLISIKNDPTLYTVTRILAKDEKATGISYQLPSVAKNDEAFKRLRLMLNI